MAMFTCSVGVMAYNEEANIGALLDALLRQRLTSCKIREIIVVASGCTDNTEKIVREYAQRAPKIRLLAQERREGKASAINLFLQKAKGDIYIIESGDTLPLEDTIEFLVRPFHDPSIGMTGCRPLPVNDPNTFMGFTAHLLWNLHHKLSLEHPKLGEMVAFRNGIRLIPTDTAVDEACIEALITKQGYRLHYASEALVRNKGAETIHDFLRQRRRITAGHTHLKRTLNYTVSTTKVMRIFKLLWGEMGWNPKAIFWTLGVIALEFWGRLLGKYDFYVKKKNPFTWEIATSTKELKPK